MQNGEYYSRGKFLLTGEYLVLYGAKALAVPLKPGQRMIVREIAEPGIIQWETYVTGNLWFKASFKLEGMDILDASDRQTAIFILNLLKAASRLQPLLIIDKQGFKIENHIEFDIRWGLGSSSTLVSNMAWWLGISPLKLYRELYRGSGYDVFCARAGSPILYQLKGEVPVFMEISFNPAFSDHLYFVYLGRKQDSQQSVDQFRNKSVFTENYINKVSDLTVSLINASSLEKFLEVMGLHEDLISSVLGKEKVKRELFPDFPGEIKSLGAWGGDFVLAASKAGSKEVLDYFRSKNLETVFGWKEIVFGN